MTTYDLIRNLAKLDPEGNMQIMLSVRYAKTAKNGNETVAEASGFIDSLSVEQVEDGARFLILEAIEM